VTLYHDAAAAEACLADWDLRFSKRDLASAELPVLTLPEARDVIAVVAHAYSEVVGMPKSNGDIRRLIQGGSIQLNGEKISDPKAIPDWKAGDVLKLDKKSSVRLG
jgi:tyrosyl-tRNA synthetase